MAGLLDYLTDKENPLPMLALMGIAGAAGSRSNGEAVSNGLQGLLGGIIAMENKKEENAKYQTSLSRQQQQDELEKRVKEAQIQHYQQQNGADPYWTTLDTPQGLVKFNARTGEALPIDLNGQPIVKSSSSVPLQAALAGGKKNAETANTLFEQQGSDGSTQRFMGNQFPNFQSVTPSFQSQQPQPQQAQPFNIPQNNNVGNLRNLNGQGFQQFATPEEGQQALSRQIGLYSTRHGIDNLNDFTSRYAPKGDGNNDPAAYARFLSQQTDIPVDAHGIDFSNPEINAKMTNAIPIMEQGWRSNPQAANKKIAQGNAFGDLIAKGAQDAVANGIMTKPQASQMAKSVVHGAMAVASNPFKSQSTADKLALENRAAVEKQKQLDAVSRDSEKIKTDTTKTEGASEVNRILALAYPLLDKATGSEVGFIRDESFKKFGKVTEGAEAIAQLEPLSAQLLAATPKAPGAQSEKELAVYQKATGDLSNPRTPPELKKKAADIIFKFNEKWATNPQTPQQPQGTQPAKLIGNDLVNFYLSGGK